VLTGECLQSLIPVVMSGIIAVYGLVVSVLIAGSRTCHLYALTQTLKLDVFFVIVSPRVDYPLFAGFVHLGAGLACGLTGLAAGYAIGFVGDSVSPIFPYVPRFPLNVTVYS